MMLEDPQSTDSTDNSGTPADPPAKKAPAKRTAAKKATVKKTVAKKTTADKARAKKAATAPDDSAAPAAAEGETVPAKKAAVKKTTVKRAAAKKTTGDTARAKKAASDAPAEAPPAARETAAETAPSAAPLFQAPEVPKATVTRRTRKSPATRRDEASAGSDASETADSGAKKPEAAEDKPAKAPAKKASSRSGRSSDKPGADGDQKKPAEQQSGDQDQQGEDDDDTDGSGNRRRRRRGGRRRRKPGEGDADGSNQQGDEQDDSDSASDDQGGDGTSRRRRRRRRTGEDGDDGGDGGDDPQNTVTRVRKTRSAEDQITAVSGSTRLEAKKQRRREGREAGRRRAPIVSEAEFLARRESVERVMAIRQRDELTQIAVLEDKVLVEHYVARESQNSIIGNVYLGRVQNVLPSMEAAFVDIGKGRNAVLYAGEVNWSALGHKDGQPRKIESVLSSGQSVLVQVSKDPIGHKGARLTSQVSLAGRFLVYVPDGTTSGISRKLPDTERTRLKTLLKEIVPDSAGVIVRTAAEGASEDELTRDVERLKARWEDIEKKSKGNAPQLLYGEPDLTLKVVRDLFTEDFSKLVIEGDDAWDTVQNYVQHVAPDLEERLERFERGDNGKDIFATYRIDEQIAKGLDRKVWLPSGGSLVIDRTEAMTVIDVNTGKFTGSGGNLEETVTKNNLEAAEEIVRQLRLRDIGGIIVVDFIDMVLESNRDLVLRRLVECLGRDRTRHQVAEVTSLGLVQMTRKRIGTGLVEAFSENCQHCQGRGVVIQDQPVEPKAAEDDSRRGGGRRSRGGGSDNGGGGGGRGRGRGDGDNDGNGGSKAPSPKDVAAMAKAENAEKSEQTDGPGKSDRADEPVKPDKGEQPETAAQPDAAADTSEQTDAPAAPVTTRTTRRRGGRSPQTDAPAESTDQPAEQQPEPTPVETAPVAAKGAPEPAAETPVVEAAPEPAAAPEKPKVVTRTRRRSASRPAGPPAAGEVPSLTAATAPSGVGEPPATGSVEPGTVVTDPGVPEAPVVEHVPIKKKGSRKR